MAITTEEQRRDLRAALTGGEGGVPDAGLFATWIDGLLNVNRDAQMAEVRRLIGENGGGAMVPAGRAGEAGAVEPAPTVNAWRSTGGARDAEAMDMRIKALSQPAEYHRLRTAAVDEIQKAVTTAFNAAYAQFVSAGYSNEDAEKEALKGAQVVKDSMYKAMHAKFGDDELFLRGTSHHNTAFKIPH